MNDWVTQLSDLAQAIMTQITESQKLDATINSQTATIMEKINALDTQINNLNSAKTTLQQAIAIAKENVSTDKAEIDYTKVAIYLALGFAIAFIIKKFIFKKG